MGVVHSLPSDWKTIIRPTVCTNEIKSIPCTPYIKLNWGSVPISDVTSKLIYVSFLRKKQTPLTAQQKLTDKYSETSITGKRFTLSLSVLHLIPNWENFNTKFLTTLSLRMINYFALAFRNPLIVRFAMKNQNPSNIYSPVVNCLLNLRKTSCPGWKIITSL